MFLATTVLYPTLGWSWTAFLLFFLVPDLSMIGYLGGPRIGARIYNLVHFYGGPVVLAGAGWFLGEPYLTPLGVIWMAHIGLDRALGFGLKMSSGFRDTHLGRIGRS